jgi:hypothetical protein
MVASRCEGSHVAVWATNETLVIPITGSAG